MLFDQSSIACKSPVGRPVGRPLGCFGEAVWEASGRLLGGFCAPLPGASSVCIYIAKPPRSLHLRTPSGSFITMYLHREASKKPPFPGASSVCIYIDLPVSPALPGPARLWRRPGPVIKAISPSRAPVPIHREFGTRHKLPQTTTTTTTTTVSYTHLTLPTKRIV